MNVRNMRRPLLALVVLSFIAGTALAAEAQTWKGVSLMDTQCVTRFKENPDSHTTKCALQCVKNGYGIVATDGAFLKLDAAGNKMAETALKATKKTDHLRATVTGELQGDTIKVASLSLD